MSSVVNKNYEAYYNWQSLHRSLSEEESYALDRFRVFATKMRSLKELELGQELTPLTGVSRKIADNLLKWRSASCAADDVVDHRDHLPADHPDSPSQPPTTPEDQCRALLHADPATQSLVFDGYRSYLVLQAIAQSCSRYVVSGDEWTQMSEAKRNETLQELRKCKESSRKQAERRFDALFAERDRFGVPANMLEEICQFSVNYQLSEHKALQSAASVTNPDERYYYSRQAIIASLTHEIPVSLGSQAGYWGAFALARSKLLPEAVRLFTQPAAIIAGIGLTAGDGYELGVNALDLESSLAKGDAASYQTLTLINRSVGLVVDVLGEATQTFVSIGKCMKGDNGEDIADADWHSVSKELKQEALAIEAQEAGVTEDTPPNVWTIINKEQQTAIIVIDGNRRFNRETKIMIAKQLKKAREAGYSPHIEMSHAAAQANPDVPVVLVTTLDDTDEGQTDQETNKEENTLAGSIARALYAPIDHLVDAAEEVTDAAAQASTPQAEADPVQPAQPRPSVANLLLGVPDRIAKCLSLSLSDDGGIPPSQASQHSGPIYRLMDPGGDLMEMFNSLNNRQNRDRHQLAANIKANYLKKKETEGGTDEDLIIEAVDEETEGYEDHAYDREAGWKRFVEEIVLPQFSSKEGVKVFKSGDEYVFIQAEGRTVTIRLHMMTGEGRDIESRRAVYIFSSETDETKGVTRMRLTGGLFGKQDVYLEANHETGEVTWAKESEKQFPRINMPNEHPVIFTRDEVLETIDPEVRPDGPVSFDITHEISFTPSELRKATRPIVILDPDAPVLFTMSPENSITMPTYDVDAVNAIKDQDPRYDLQAEEVVPAEYGGGQACSGLGDIAHWLQYQMDLARKSIADGQPERVGTHNYIGFTALTYVRGIVSWQLRRSTQELDPTEAHSRVALEDQQLLIQNTKGEWTLLAFAHENEHGNIVPRWFEQHMPDQVEEQGMPHAARVEPVDDVFVVDEKELARFETWRKSNSPDPFKFSPIKDVSDGESTSYYAVILKDNSYDKQAYSTETDAEGVVNFTPYDDDQIDVEIIQATGNYQRCAADGPENVVLRQPTEERSPSREAEVMRRGGEERIRREDVRDVLRDEEALDDQEEERRLRGDSWGRTGESSRRPWDREDNRLDEEVGDDDDEILDDDFWDENDHDDPWDRGDRDRGHNWDDDDDYKHFIDQHAASRAGALSLYPQPAADVVLLRGQLNRNSQAYIQTITGQVLFQHAFHTSADRSISVGSLPSGVYLLQVEQPAGIQVLRFVKQ